MKTIELQELDVLNATMWNHASYPAPGYYLTTDENNSTSIVYVSNNASNGVLGMIEFSDDKFPVGEGLAELEEIKMPDMGLISSDTMLKAIAIAQDPSLAEKLTT